MFFLVHDLKKEMQKQIADLEAQTARLEASLRRRRELWRLIMGDDIPYPFISQQEAQDA